MEFYGDEGTGKTQTLLHLVANCILPKTWNGLQLGGLETGVLYIDTGCQFCMLRLTAMLESRIIHQVAVEASAQVAAPTNIQVTAQTHRNHKAEKKPRVLPKEEDVETIIKMSLRRLFVVRCHTSCQLVVTLHGLEGLLGNKPDIALLLVDSLSSFYWQDRSNGGESFAAQEANQHKVAAALYKLVKTYNLTVIAVKLALFVKRSVAHTEGELWESPRIVAPPRDNNVQEHCEYLSKTWQKMVTMRCIFQKVENVKLKTISEPIFQVRVHRFGVQEKGHVKLFAISETGLQFDSVKL